MSLDVLYKPVKEELKAVEKRLYELTRLGNRTISEALSEIFSAGGKRLRPALLLMAAKACNYTGERSIDLAVAIELIHTASLVHDDVIDYADLRRGIPTINSRWGNKVSVLVGDHLYAKVVGLLTDDGDQEMIRSVVAATARMTDSEITQTLSRNDVNLTEERYLSIITGKTAALMSCSCRIGAMLGKGNDSEVDILSEYGLNLGIAFQIKDDLLDFVGSKERLGKPLGKDICEGSLTLPFVHAMKVAKENDRQRMIDAFRSGRIDDDVLTWMRYMVAAYGGIEHSLEKAREHGRACKKGLEALRESEARTSLVMLADYVVERAC